MAAASAVVADCGPDVLWKGVQVGDQLLNDSNLGRQQISVLCVKDLMLSNRADTIHVVANVHGTGLPERIIVHRAEEDQFHNHIAAARLLDEISEALEIPSIPLREIKFVAAI